MTQRVLITGAGRDTGRLLARSFVAQGADVIVTARSLAAAEETVALIQADGGKASAMALDLSSPESVRALAIDRLDVLVNSGARYLVDSPGCGGVGVGEATANDIMDTIAGGAAGTVLLTEHLLPVLRKSSRADIVNVISAVADPGHSRSEAHAAFYAAKHAHAGYAEILSHRLRPEGIRVISLYPPDFVQDGPREAGAQLTAASVVDCVLFAVNQPRDCFIKAFHFEQV